MKDKFLQQQFDFYADAVKPSDRVLEGAFAELENSRDKMREKAIARRRNITMLKRTLFAGAAVVVLIIALNIFGNYFSPGGNKNGTQAPAAPAAYSLSDLKCTAVPESELVEIKNTFLQEAGETGEDAAEIKTLNFPGGTSYDIKCYVYTDTADGGIYAVMIVYKAERDGCTDEIIIISDRTGGLTGQQAKTYYDYYENGEYYSNIYLTAKAGVYYIKIMSPQDGAGEYYEGLLK